jgi:ketosteroid isomerase-like protein
MTVTRQLQIRVLGMFGVLAALSACANRRARLEAFDTGLPIVAARQQWNAALLAGDTAALARLVEDSAAHVSPQFTHIGRAAFLAQFVRGIVTRPDFRLVYTTERATPCERPNCNTATESGTWSETWLEDGEPTTVSGTYYAIWRRDAAVWRIRSEVFATARCRGRRYCGS